MVTDELGAVRHAMSINDLRELYKRLENFIADCTRNEVDENRDAINGVLTLVHKRMLDLQNSSNRRGQPRHKKSDKMIIKS